MTAAGEGVIRRIVILGGGTAGWMTAAALGKHLRRSQYPVELVESDQIGTIGVGEATVPPIREFNRQLGLDEAEFMSASNATFKLGIMFENWGHAGNRYSHPFGTYGYAINQVGFQHYWLKMHQGGDDTPFHAYNLPHLAMDRERFSREGHETRELNLNFFYAYHLDATKYAAYLRQFAEAQGVVRTEGKVADVEVNPESGDIEALVLESGQRVEGDLFIDCSGFRGLLIEQTLKTGWVDWSHWLPCNRAWASPTWYRPDVDNIPTYTRSRALSAGWQWRVALQNRTGDGHVFCDEFISEDEACAELLANVEGESVQEPRLLRFAAGGRKLAWNRNCVAIGLSSGFLEPLESTSIHLIQMSIVNLLRLLPGRDIDPATRTEFNRVMAMQTEESRDFIILHYKATQRDDTAFWRYCAEMSVPEELQRKIDLFKASGFVDYNPYILFAEHSWLAVMLGQGIIPERYDPRADFADETRVRDIMAKWRGELESMANGLPTHADTLRAFCPGDYILKSDRDNP